MTDFFGRKKMIEKNFDRFFRSIFFRPTFFSRPNYFFDQLLFSTKNFRHFFSRTIFFSTNFFRSMFFRSKKMFSSKGMVIYFHLPTPRSGFEGLRHFVFGRSKKSWVSGKIPGHPGTNSLDSLLSYYPPLVRRDPETRGGNNLRISVDGGRRSDSTPRKKWSVAT